MIITAQTQQEIFALLEKKSAKTKWYEENRANIRSDLMAFLYKTTQTTTAAGSPPGAMAA